MQSHRDQSICELSSLKIFSLLQYSAFQIHNQKITSAETNNNENINPDVQKFECGGNTEGINAFLDLPLNKNVKRIIDVGGGRFDANKDYMKLHKQIELLVWDPFNRKKLHNAKIENSVLDKKADSATSMSVLNVIPNPEDRLAHLVTLKAAIVVDGKAFIKIWPGEGVLKGSYLPSGTASKYQANAYSDRFLSEVEIVFGRGNAKLHPTIKNLIVATKKTEHCLLLDDIEGIQSKQEAELEILREIRAHSVRQIYVKENILKMFKLSFSMFNSNNHTIINATSLIRPAKGCV